LRQASYNFKSVDGGIGKYGIFVLRITWTVDQEQHIHISVRLDKLPLAKGMFVVLVQLFSTKNVVLLHIMPGGLIQPTRVGVTIALGMKVMARKNSELLGLIGTGGKARAHYRFMTSVLEIKKVKVFSPNPEHRKKFTEEMARETGVPGEPVNSAEEAVRDGDIVCSATNSSRPVLNPDWLRPGMHYNSIREFETDLTALARCDLVAIHSPFARITHNPP